MDEEGFEHAVISNAAYNFYEKGEDHAQDKIDDYLEGYTIDPEHSDDHAVTVLRPDGSAIIGYRGTDPWNIYDIGADTLILSGYHREKMNTLPFTRFQRASDHYTQVSNKYDVSSVTGHSLGGSISDFVGRKHDVNAYAFNPGESPFEYARFGLVEPSKTKVYTTGDDPISASSFAYRNHQKVVQVPKKVEGGYYYLDSHSLMNFLPGSIVTGTQGSETTKKESSEVASLIETRENRLCRLYPELCPKGD